MSKFNIGDRVQIDWVKSYFIHTNQDYSEFGVVKGFKGEFVDVGGFNPRADTYTLSFAPEWLTLATPATVLDDHPHLVMEEPEREPKGGEVWDWDGLVWVCDDHEDGLRVVNLRGDTGLMIAHSETHRLAKEGRFAYASLEEAARAGVLG